MLNVARSEDEMKAKDEELKTAQDAVKKFETERKDMEDKIAEILKEKEGLYMQLQNVRTTIIIPFGLCHLFYLEHFLLYFTSTLYKHSFCS